MTLSHRAHLNNSSNNYMYNNYCITIITTTATITTIWYFTVTLMTFFRTFMFYRTFTALYTFVKILLLEIYAAQESDALPLSYRAHLNNSSNNYMYNNYCITIITTTATITTMRYFTVTLMTFFRTSMFYRTFTLLNTFVKKILLEIYGGK